MPKRELVNLNLHPVTCIRRWDESPDLKPFLQPLSRTVARYNAGVKAWLLEKRKENINDKEMADHLKAVLELLLTES